MVAVVVALAAAARSRSPEHGCCHHHCYRAKLRPEQIGGVEPESCQNWNVSAGREGQRLCGEQTRRQRLQGVVGDTTRGRQQGRCQGCKHQDQVAVGHMPGSRQQRCKWGGGAGRRAAESNVWEGKGQVSGCLISCPHCLSPYHLSTAFTNV